MMCMTYLFTDEGNELLDVLLVVVEKVENVAHLRILLSHIDLAAESIQNLAALHEAFLRDPCNVIFNHSMALGRRNRC